MNYHKSKTFVTTNRQKNLNTTGTPITLPCGPNSITISLVLQGDFFIQMESFRTYYIISLTITLLLCVCIFLNIMFMRFIHEECI